MPARSNRCPRTVRVRALRSRAAGLLAPSNVPGQPPSQATRRGARRPASPGLDRSSARVATGGRADRHDCRQGTTVPPPSCAASQPPATSRCAAPSRAAGVRGGVAGLRSARAEGGVARDRPARAVPASQALAPFAACIGREPASLLYRLRRTDTPSGVPFVSIVGTFVLRSMMSRHAAARGYGTGLGAGGLDIRNQANVNRRIRRRVPRIG